MKRLPLVQPQGPQLFMRSHAAEVLTWHGLDGNQFGAY